jgi:antitoxin component YwqK of YwqJK toxin-antitoxin module
MVHLTFGRVIRTSARKPAVGQGAVHRARVLLRNSSAALLVVAACGGSQSASDHPTLGEDHDGAFSWKEPAHDWWKKGDAACPDGGKLEKGEENATKLWQCKKGEVAHGPRVGWYKDGKKAMEGLLRDGEPQGIWREWRPDGELAAEAHFQDGELEGTTVQHLTGGARIEESYKAGKRHGVSRWYEAGNKLVREAHFTEGKLNGEQVEYYPTGQKRLTASYVDGLPNGRIVRYAPDGKEVGHFDIAGGTGTWIEWYDDGQKKSETQLTKGIPSGTHVRYHPNGKKAAEGRYQAGKEMGEWRGYSEEGLLAVTTQYEAGRGKEMRIYEKGKLARRDTFNDNEGRASSVRYAGDKEQGVSVTWRPDGMRATQGSYEKGKKDGDWYVFAEDGKVDRVESYKKGKMVKKKKAGDAPVPPAADGLETGVESCDFYLRRYLKCERVPDQVRSAFLQNFTTWKQQAKSEDAASYAKLEDACRQASGTWKEGLQRLGC